MARQMPSQSVLDDVTECSICTEAFTDPRVLPCIHTFCLTCLLNYGRARRPGDTMPCPLCRNEFTIPDNGFAGIQKSFLMEKLLNARKPSADKEPMHSYLTNTSTYLSPFEKDKNEFIRKLIHVESEINKTAVKLTDSVRRDIKKLSAIKQARELETAKEQVELHMAALESFKQYNETVLSSGTAICDVTRSAKSSHDRDRPAELRKVDADSSVSVNFTSSAALNRKDENNSSRPTVPQCRVVPASKGKRIGGVTSSGDDVFVLRLYSPDIEVYDAATLTLRRRVTVPGLGSKQALGPLALAVCAFYKCLYISNHGPKSDTVHRVELSADGVSAVMKWSVEPWPVGLSVNSAQHVLVLNQGKPRCLQEFTTHGSLVHNIPLERSIECPVHAVQLSSGMFLVSHYGTSQQRVCMMDVNGEIVLSHGGSRGPDVTQMDYPAGLAADKHGNVLVADRLNNRLLVLDQSLSSAHEMSVSVVGGLQDPFSLFYDESRHRLYIGEWKGGRVIVIDNLKDFGVSEVLTSS